MWEKFSIFNIFMKEFITLAIALTIIAALVIMFWFFYTLPLYIVWNFVVTPIFNCDTLSLIEAFLMMVGFNIIYIIVAYVKTPDIVKRNMKM